MWSMNAAISGLLASLVERAYGPAFHSLETPNIGKIAWTTCPDLNSTQCASLSVPMDYTNPNSNSTVSVFLRKYPATAAPDQKLGSLLINPGGPGNSGTATIASAGAALSMLVDGRYDIIGFDSRAVNLTGPPTACHDIEYKFAARAYQLNLLGAPFPHVGGEGELAHVTKLAGIQASHHAACVQNGNHEMLRNSGTVAVAKDIEKIVEALGEDGLNYIGYSYGTILGATFAAIRPNLVKRMVLDGVSDAELYFTDVLEWARSGPRDAHKALRGFMSSCIEAGPSQCALATTKDNKTETVESLTKRLDALYTRLGKQPLVVGDSLTGPGIIQAHNVQFVTFGLMYSPSFWPYLAQALAMIEQGDGQDFYPIINDVIYGAMPQPYTQNIFNRSMQSLPASTREAQYPILCGDSPQLNITVEEYADYFREMGKLTLGGEQLALLIGGCRGWSFRATETYTGPWTVEKGLNKTRFPILFVTLDADPITPLASAVKMSSGFGSESASLLIQQGFGHTSLAHPSLCTAKNIRDYFVDGIVPKNGTHCTPEPGWIYPANSTASKRTILATRDKNLLEAIKGIARSRVVTGF